MTKVIGATRIEKTISRLLDKSKTRLYNAMVGREEKFLCVVLDALGVYGGNLVSAIVGSSYSQINLDFYKALIGFKAILDAILEQGISSIDLPSDHEFSNIFQSILASLDIAKYWHLLDIQQTFKLNEAEIENGEIRDTRDRGFYEATRLWVDRASSEPEWENWYLDNHPQDMKSVRPMLEREFKKAHNLRLNDLGGISGYLERLSRDYATRRPTPQPLRSRWEIRQTFVRNMDRIRAVMWLRELEYRPGRSLFKSPLVPLSVSKRDVYYVAVWAFTPSNHFFNYWISEILARPASNAARTWGQKYGDAFESYLSLRVKEADINVKDLGSLHVSVNEYPEIVPWLAKLLKSGGFQVDRIMVKGERAYAISCKADLVLDRKLSVRDYFFPARETERRVLKNLHDMSEIWVEVDCVKHNPQVLGRRGQKLVEGKTIFTGRGCKQTTAYGRP